MKCSKCNKLESAFKDLKTKKEICIWCWIKSRYEEDGFKIAFKVIKFHLKCKWYMMEWWKKGLVYTLGSILIIWFLLSIIIKY